MKKNGKISVYNLTVILLLFVSLISYGQNKQDKIISIINKLNLVEVQKINYEYRLRPLKNVVSGNDSVKLVELEKQLTDEHITKIINATFVKVFNDEEVNDIYNFINSSLYEKLFNPGELFKAVSASFNDFDEEIVRITNNLDEPIISPVPIFKPIPVDREDGFYATIDDVNAKGDKEVILEMKPLLTSKDILVVKENIHEGMFREISIQFTKVGAQKLYFFTKENIRKPMAIVIAKHIVLMPTINDAIMAGRISITGNFTDNEVGEMIERLKSKE